MKKLISMIIAAIMLFSTVAAPSAYAAENIAVTASDSCTKILLVGNSYTYYNGMDQLLCKICNEAGKDVMVVSAVKSGMDANLLLNNVIPYYVWYRGERIEKGTGYLEDIAQKDIGGINRARSWDYVILQNNDIAAQTGMGDVYMLGLFRNMLEDNCNFIIHSNYWVDSLEKDRHEEHMAVAKATGCSLIDTRGLFSQFHRVFEDDIWFRALTLRDGRNHPSMWGTYLFALSVYAKIYGTEGFAQSIDDEVPLLPYNSDGGTVHEFLDTDKFKIAYNRNESVTRRTAAGMQALVSDYESAYIGAPLEETQKQSLPAEDVEEDLRYYYYEDNTPYFGWRELSGCTYYLEDGRILTDGFYDISGTTYYFDKYGERYSDWFSYDGTRYYLHSDGSVAKGWLTLHSSNGTECTFYFTKKGALVTGQKTINGKTYYFSKGNEFKLKGEMYRNEWRHYTDSKGNAAAKYYNQNGVMLTGLKTLEGNSYYFSKSGLLQTATLVTNGSKTYYANAAGVLQKSKFVTVNATRYYFNKNGVMLKKRFFEKNGSRYYADKTGAVRKGWTKIKGKYYYFAKTKTKKTPKYAMYKGEHKIGGKVYKFNKNGVCLNRDK